MDANNSCVVMVQLCFSWLGLRLDALGASIYFFVALLAIYTKVRMWIRVRMGVRVVLEKRSWARARTKGGVWLRVLRLRFE